MIPILFAENSTTFSSNGIGRLSEALSCEVTEERNGQFELSMMYPMTGKYFGSIALRNIIVADASPAQKKQPFRIYKISKPINGRITINAQHISYDLSKNVSMPFSVTASSSACANTLNGLKNNSVESCPFTFSTNVTTVASYTQIKPATIRQMLGGVEGSVLDQFGGEYKFDKFTVSLLNSRGTNKNVPLRYGKNITDIKQEENISNTITGIVPYWTDAEGGDIVTLTEKVIHSSNAGNFSSYLTTPIDFSSDFEEKPTETQLRTHAQAYINKNNIGVPKVSIDVEFVNLADTEEYKDLLNLLQLELCDIIPVEFSRLGISTTAKVVKTEYNVLKNRYNKITVGSIGSSLAKTITGVSDSVTGLADATKTNFAKVSNETDAKISTATANFPTRQDVQTEIDNATAWITATGGIIRALKNSNDEWTDLLCCSANATASTGNVLRFNVNGIGFSSTGWNGPFTQAWTLDGRMVIGGTNVPSLTVYDNNSNVIFQVDATEMIWNATNSSMNSYGTITANSGVFTDCIIKSNDPTRPYYLKLDSGYISFGTSDVDGASISGTREKILIDASNSGYVFDSNTTFGVKTDGNMDFETYSGDMTIKSHSGNMYLKTDANNKTMYLQSSGDMEMQANGLIYANGPFAVQSCIYANSGSIIVSDDPEIRFYDGMNGYTDNITLEGDVVIIEADEIVVRTSRDSGSYKKGYTGSFLLRNSNGGTTTLNFFNGILC